MNYEATPERWQDVAEAVRERREELGLTQADAVTASHGGIGQSTWSHLERGDKATYQQAKLRSACRVLGWSHDSIARIIAGQEPIVLTTRSEELELSARLWKIEDTIRGLLARFDLLHDDLRRLEAERHTQLVDRPDDQVSG